MEWDGDIGKDDVNMERAELPSWIPRPTEDPLDPVEVNRICKHIDSHYVNNPPIEPIKYGNRALYVLKEKTDMVE